MIKRLMIPGLRAVKARPLVSRLLGRDVDIASQRPRDEGGGSVVGTQEGGQGAILLPNEEAAAGQWQELFGQPPPPRARQKDLQEVVDAQQFNSFLQRISGKDKARLLSLNLHGATAWAAASPSPQLGNHLPSPVLRIILRLVLGLPQPGLPVRDTMGHDALSQTGRLMIGRHNDVARVVLRTCRRFWPQARLEVATPDVEHQDRPGDVFTRGLSSNGNGSYIDVAIANACAVSYQPVAQHLQGHAALTIAKGKVAKRGAVAVRSVGYEFRAVVGEAFGGWLPEAYSTLQLIANRASAHLCEGQGQVLQHLLQNLSVAIMRGSASMIASAIRMNCKGDEWDAPL